MSLNKRICGVLLSINPSNKSFNPVINPNRVMNMVMLKVTPTAATSVCFHLASSNDFATLIKSLYFILVV